jgi:hypothetical protein
LVTATTSKETEAQQNAETDATCVGYYCAVRGDVEFSAWLIEDEWYAERFDYGTAVGHAARTGNLEYAMWADSVSPEPRLSNIDILECLTGGTPAENIMDVVEWVLARRDVACCGDEACCGDPFGLPRGQNQQQQFPKGLQAHIIKWAIWNSHFELADFLLCQEGWGVRCCQYVGAECILTEAALVSARALNWAWHKGFRWTFRHGTMDNSAQDIHKEVTCIEKLAMRTPDETVGTLKEREEREELETAKLAVTLGCPMPRGGFSILKACAAKNGKHAFAIWAEQQEQQEQQQQGD